jgi:hypothetical protein
VKYDTEQTVANIGSETLPKVPRSLVEVKYDTEHTVANTGSETLPKVP